MEKINNNDKQLMTLQNTVRSLLHAFYTGSGLSLKNKLAYPYFLVNDRAIKRKINEITQIVASLEGTEEKEALLRLGSQLEKKKFFFSEDVASFLYLLYNILRKKEEKKSKHIQIYIPSINITAYPLQDKEYIYVLKKLNMIGERLHTEKKGTLLLFGSLATRDYVKGHSDLDTVFIISKEACLDKKKLLEIRKDIAEIMGESYFIDSLQHHGPYIFTEYDLDMFPQYYLPFAVWKNMVSFCGDVELKFTERQASPEEMIGELRRYKEMFLEILETPVEKLPKSNYSRKYLYQAILLFPAVYLLVKGQPCYKRDSFVLIRKHLKSQGNMLLDALSEVWSTNGFNTRAASPSIQKLSRMISYPFCYPFVYRLFYSQTLREEQKQKIELHLREGAKDFITVIDVELKKLQKKNYLHKNRGGREKEEM